MIYQKFLNKLKKTGLCPFCSITKELIIKENRHAYLTLARAPYVKNHFIVIPKRHVTKLHDLKKREKAALLDLAIEGIDNLHKKYKGIEIEYKEGELLSARKSIPHSHMHLIPKRTKHSTKYVDKRKFLQIKELTKQTKEIKKLFTK